MIRFSARTQMLDHYSITETISLCARLGFEGLELGFLSRDFKFRPDMLEQFYSSRVLSASKEAGIPVEAVSFHRDFTTDDTNFDILKKIIPVTRNYGASICIISSTRRQYSEADAELWDKLKTRLGVLLDIAEKNGVTLALEFEPGDLVGSTQELFQLLDEVGSPYLKSNADLGHIFLCDSDPLLALASQRFCAVHGHIENMFRGVHRHQLPHFGDMVIEDYIKILSDIDLALAIDVYDYDYEKIAPAALAYLKGIRDNL